MLSKRRRVAHVLPSTTIIGGTEYGTLRIARAIASAGYENVAFCIEGDTPVREFFLGEGFPVASFPIVEPSLRRPMPFVRAAHALAAEFRRRGVQLVHCADVLSAFHTAFAARLAGIPVISHVRSRHDHLSRRDQLFLRPVDRWLFVSNETRRRFSYRAAARRGRVLYDGVERPAVSPDDRLVVRHELGIANDAPVIGMVARVSPQKDFTTLARAARKVLHAHPSARFLVIGDHSRHPEFYQALRATLADQKLDGHFVFTGFRRDVEKFVAAIDVSVLCSHIEGLPLVLLEGMAQGKPTLATDIDGIPEIIAHGDTGLLHRHEDADELARQLVAVLNDPALAARIGEAGRHRVETFWSEERFTGELLEEYGRLLRHRRTDR